MRTRTRHTRRAAASHMHIFGAFSALRRTAQTLENSPSIEAHHRPATPPVFPAAHGSRGPLPRRQPPCGAAAAPPRPPKEPISRCRRCGREHHVGSRRARQRLVSRSPTVQRVTPVQGRAAGSSGRRFSCTCGRQALFAALGEGAEKRESRLPEKRGGAFELGCRAYRYRWMRAETKKMPLPTVVFNSTRLRREICSQLSVSMR